MATLPKCHHCANYYDPYTRPKCEGAECAEYRIGSFAGICVFCCAINLFPRAKRQPHRVSPTLLLCVSCGRSIPELCLCCPDAIYCDMCCDQSNHMRCCKKTKKVIFTQHDLYFAVPAPAPDDIQFLTRNESLGVLDKTSPISMLNAKGFETNQSRRFASIEIEVFHYTDATNLNTVLEKWRASVVRDGSMYREHTNRLGRGHTILNADKSFEINTSPACGDALVNQLREVTDALKEAKAHVTLSCGLHVHVDCRDFGYQEIHKLIRVYAYIEDALFASLHPSRLNNNFCNPCGKYFIDKFINGVKPDTKSLKPALIKGVYGDNALAKVAGRSYPTYWDSRADHYGRQHNALGGRNEVRYMAWNLHSYFLRGTVESRMHHGTTDFKEIYDWAKLHIDLFDSVYKIPENVLNKLLEVSTSEIEGAKQWLDTKNDKIAIGAIVLRALLPDNTFNSYVEKASLMLHDKELSESDLLPCQKGVKLPDGIRVPSKPKESSADRMARMMAEERDRLTREAAAQVFRNAGDVPRPVRMGRPARRVLYANVIEPAPIPVPDDED